MKILTLLFVLFSYTTYGQLNKRLYETFELKHFNEVSFDLIGEMNLETWPGSALMVETNIDLYQSTQKMLDFFEESGRYKVSATKADSTLNLSSLNKERKMVRTDKGISEEVVTIKVYIPEEFEIISNTLIRRKETTQKKD